MGSQIPIFERNDNPDDLIAALTLHTPYSLPLLRRLEFLHKTGYQTPHSHILASFKDQDVSLPFIAAHLDFSCGPDTEMWLFSSLQLPPGYHMHTLEELELAEQQVLSLFKKVNEIKTRERKGTGNEDGFVGPRIKEAPGTVLVGVLHEKVLEVLKTNGKVIWNTEPIQKLVFERARLPEPIALPWPDLKWNKIRPCHVPFVLSQSAIPRQPDAILAWPSLAIFTSMTTSPIAWAFIGFDGSIKSLHVEEQFRRRGLGKILTLQLLHNNVATFNGGWCHADVAVSNAASLRTCTSLRGKNMDIVYWAVVKASS